MLVNVPWNTDNPTNAIVDVIKPKLKRNRIVYAKTEHKSTNLQL